MCADVTQESEKIIAEINRRAQLFVFDNYRLGLDVATVKNIMLIGASIRCEVETRHHKTESDNDQT